MRGALETLPPAVYEIRVKGRLVGEQWTQWFNGMRVTVNETGETTLHGRVTDQAALYGLLSRLRDLALPLLSVTRVELDPEAASAPVAQGKHV